MSWIRVVAVLCCLVMVSTGVIGANPEAASLHPPDTELASTIIVAPTANLTNTDGDIVVLDPKIDRVMVVSSEYDFKAETESFTGFRDHYAVFWGLFSIMMIVDAVWID